MNLKRRTGYGVYDISRQIARRLQQEWEMVESPPRPRRLLADVIPLPRPDEPPPAPARRQLAA